MAKSKTTERDENHELSRRALIKWSLAAGAALGLSRGRIAEVLNKTAGQSIAYASDNKAHRYVGVYMGVGALAWSQLLWPNPDIAGATGNANLSYHKLNQPNLAPAGTDKPLWLGVDSPFQDLAASRQITGFLCGNASAHDSDSDRTTSIGANKLYAAITAIQSTLPSVVPAIRVSNVGNGPVSYGTAPGASAVSTVNTAGDFVNLFNAAASTAGGLLVNSNDAALYKQTYQSFAGLVRASGRSTNIKAYQTASTAAGFLGTNLAAQLEVTPADLARYGVNGGTRGPIAEFANLLITTVKAFKLGLTNSVLTNLLQDDPHGAFAGGDDGAGITSTVPSLKNVFNGFMADLKAAVVDGEALDNQVVMSITGDTPKDCRQRAGWGDGSNTGIVLALGAGHLKTGWFGNYPVTGNVKGFNPETGAETDQYNGAMQAQAACSAIAFAVAGGDERRVGDFSNGASYAGLVNPIAI